jgi:ribose 5-phosphate isomerase B
MKKKIFIGADSAGYDLKCEVIAHLKELGYEVADCGTDSSASCHYPVFAKAVCEGVIGSLGSAYGILICGTGIGMSMCANKHEGIRAGLCSDTYSAKMTRRHNDANVLCMGARVIGACLALDIVDAFLENEYEGGRHQIRLDMMREIELKK